MLGAIMVFDFHHENMPIYLGVCVCVCVCVCVLPSLNQKLLDTSTGNKTDLFEISDKYSKEMRCPNINMAFLTALDLLDCFIEVSELNHFCLDSSICLLDWYVFGENI